MIRAEDFYGGALHFDVTSDLEIYELARVMTFNASGGSWNVTFTAPHADLARRMDYTWLGGPSVFAMNIGSSAVTITYKANGQDVVMTLAAGERGVVVLYDASNRLADHPSVTPVGPDNAKAASTTVGRIIQDRDGFVHNGGSPGGTGAEICNMPSGTWSAATSSTASHGDAAGVGMHDGIHLVGNNSGTTIRQNHSRYRGGTWSSRTVFPIELQGANAGTLGFVGYIFESDAAAAIGSQPRGLRDYNDRTDAYSVKAAQPHPTHTGGCASVASKDRIMLVRGAPLQQASWLYHGPSGTYESVEFYAGNPKAAMTAFERLGLVHAVGGYNSTSGSWFNTTDLFNIATRSWSVGATIPAQRSEGAGFAWHSIGIYAGGEDNGSLATQTVYRMNTSSTWFATTNKVSTNVHSTQHGSEIAV